MAQATTQPMEAGVLSFVIYCKLHIQYSLKVWWPTSIPHFKNLSIIHSVYHLFVCINVSIVDRPFLLSNSSTIWGSLDGTIHARQTRWRPQDEIFGKVTSGTQTCDFKTFLGIHQYKHRKTFKYYPCQSLFKGQE